MPTKSEATWWLDLARAAVTGRVCGLESWARGVLEYLGRWGKMVFPLLFPRTSGTWFEPLG